MANGPVPLDDWGATSDDDLEDGQPKPKLGPSFNQFTWTRRITPSFGYGYTSNHQPSPLLMESQMEIDLVDRSSPLIVGYSAAIVDLFDRIHRVRAGHSATNVSFRPPSSPSSSTAP